MKRAILSIAMLAVCAACNRPPAALCRTPVECQGFDGKRVSVVGVYRALPHPKGAVRGETEPVIARVELAGGKDGPYLEPFWRPAARRDDAELRRLDGKRVRVTGVYHRVQPRNPSDPPYAEAMGGSCIADIEEIAPAPE
jgi:hypothetical protein